MATEKEVIEAITKMIAEGANPRETRKVINEKFPDWDDRKKLKRLEKKVIRNFPTIRKTALRRTEFYKIFLIGADDIRARGKKFTQKY